VTDPARYADMADPDRNPQFRRRWQDAPSESVIGPDPDTPLTVFGSDAALDGLAHDLATEFRSGRAGGDP